MHEHNRINGPAIYNIRVQGALGAHWTDQMNGMGISIRYQREPPETVLRGEVVDQAALLGILTTLYDMGFTLLRVEYEGQG